MVLVSAVLFTLSQRPSPPGSRSDEGAAGELELIHLPASALIGEKWFFAVFDGCTDTACFCEVEGSLTQNSRE
jgi:hypothetical protein